MKRKIIAAATAAMILGASPVLAFAHHGGGYHGGYHCNYSQCELSGCGQCELNEYGQCVNHCHEHCIY